MSAFNEKISEALGGALSNPKTLDEQRGGFQMLIDDLSKANPNENNLLSLLTLRDLYKEGEDEDKLNAIKATAKNETEHLVRAMEILTNTKATGDEKTAQEQLQRKFGKDTKGAIGLAELLKTMEDEDEAKAILKTARGKRTRTGAFSAPSE
jgi:thioredoxin-like negative regulator of GroEL